VSTPLKGRVLFVAWITVFLATAGTIALRNQAAFQARKNLAVLDDSLRAVSRVQTQLAADVATLLAPAMLRPVGERLGLRSPTDSETVSVRIENR